MEATPRNRRGWIAGAGLVAAGAVAGAVLAGTLSAGAATTPSPTTSTGSAGGYAQSGGPGVQENDGIPESQEHHGGFLDQTGTLTAVGSNTVTIKTSSATTTYQVNSSSDIDKNGEAQLSDLAAGDAVRFSVQSGTTTIDKLHAGDETKNLPAGGTTGGGGTTGATPSA